MCLEGRLSLILLPGQIHLFLITTILVSIAVLLRILSNPVGNVFQKQLTAKGHHPLVVNFMTYLLLSVVCILFAFGVNWRSLPGAFWLYSLLGGIVGASGNGFLVKALEKGELSVLGPINAYKSIVGLLVGMVLLNEFPTIWGILGIMLIIYGSYFVLNTTEEKFSWALLRKREIQYRLWAMILTAIEAVFIKKIILVSSPSIAFISWCWFGALFSFLLLWLYQLNIGREIGKIENGNYSPYLFLVVCVGTMQFTTNYVLGHMPVGYALSLFQLSVIVSVLLGHRFFNETDIRKKLIGSAIMIAGSVVIILLKG
jgi:drug/metabolite transporter (DMT)-like permease